MSTSTKVTVALNEMGQVAAASRPSSGSEVTSGMVATLGQTLVEVEVTGSVADMPADKFLAHLLEHTAVKAASARFHAIPASTDQDPTSGTL